MNRRILLGAATLGWPMLPRVVRAQRPAWPSRPVRLVVPFAAGTTTDALGRLLAAQLGRHAAPQPVVVDNRSGAGGTVGALAVAQAAPDGHTLLLGTSGTHATNPLLMPNLAYDPLRDFAPIAGVARTSVVLGVRPQLGAATLEAFLALARQRRLSLASAGTGTTGHLTQALMGLESGIETTHAPYREGGRAIADLLNGTVDAMVYHPIGFLPHIRSGAVRPLAVTGEARHFILPEVPTMAEAGLPGVVVEGWWAVYAPAGTPAPILEGLNALVNEALADPAMREEFRRQGLEAMGGTGATLATVNRAELSRQRRLVQATNMTAD